MLYIRLCVLPIILYRVVFRKRKMSSRGRAEGPQSPKKPKNKGAQLIVLDMQRIKEQLGTSRNRISQVNELWSVRT